MRCTLEEGSDCMAWNCFIVEMVVFVRDSGVADEGVAVGFTAAF